MRVWRVGRVEVAWRTHADMNPPPMKGFDLLPIRWPWWARLPVGVHVSPYTISLWLSVAFARLNVAIRRMP